TAGEGIWMVDADARTTFVNPKLQQMLAYEADELLGRRWLDFTDDAGRAAIAAATARAAAAPATAAPADVRFRRKDGLDLWATLSTSPITDGEGRAAGTLAMVGDVTERKLAQDNRTQLEGQLRESQKMEAIGTLAGGIAHDFNNILAAILGNVGLIRQDLDSGHASGARLEQIRQAGERGRSLVQQIVAFSRREQQLRIVQPLRPLLEEAATLLRSTLSTRVELELRLSEAPLHVNADATQLQQVLMNLCTNAWHAMADGAGRIVIGLEAVELDAEQAARFGWTAGRYAHVWVADNGCGMDAATQARIFEPFFTTKPVGKGTGLGLAVVHGIVTSHGGALSVDSAPGLGSTFDMYFPLAATPAEVAAVAPNPPLEGPAPADRGQHVLYVDDDPVMCVMVEGLLQRAGYRVTTVAGPREALACTHAPAARVDIVVTDFNMPEMSGLDLTRELKLFRPRMPVVMTSGYITEAVRADALAAGVSHVLQKEYTLEQLAAIVQQALAERRAA
ncbi:MAG: response regulator, partial [Burkholderiaceae bacterium]